MSSIQSLTIPANEKLSAAWRSGCRSLAYGQFWQALLIGVGSLSNLVYTCTLPLGKFLTKQDFRILDLGCKPIILVSKLPPIQIFGINAIQGARQF